MLYKELFTISTDFSTKLRKNGEKPRKTEQLEKEGDKKFRLAILFGLHNADKGKKGKSPSRRQGGTEKKW